MSNPGHVAAAAWPRVCRIVGAAGLAAFVVVAFTPLSNALDRWLTLPARIEPADAIVVLAAGLNSDDILSNNSMRRVLRGITLYKKGLAPVLALSGSPAHGRGRSEAEIRADLAREVGVAPDALLLLGTPRTTREEAVGFGRLLIPRGVHRVLLVTHGDHMPRAVRLFERAGFEVLPAPVFDAIAEAAPEDRLSTTRSLVMELAARLYYRVAGYF